MHPEHSSDFPIVAHCGPDKLPPIWQDPRPYKVTFLCVLETANEGPPAGLLRVVTLRDIDFVEDFPHVFDGHRFDLRAAIDLKILPMSQNRFA